ncbi:FGGY-family carbohydrate kinase [Thermosynechococcaceae cyanobacterium BACA0444]|uniref:D-ribulose kinase n=1 Tax=Pseudocalidococcus azoricus BACA0444 TaxID=2918990 RepID=A0AAE4FWF6_9CYAN|nr:FGGY-family carbohydrate kinase [Pseudocalidococcus azoricus]MDS3862210.1 FGGY-family carbohydrate kinase [Pseudocalidococcus azoricus BACA0444]
MSYYLGLDFGTSGARAIVIDPGQGILHQAQVSHPLNISSASCSLWQTQLDQLLQQIPHDLKGNLERIAIDGTSSTVLICDGQGHPLRDALLYNNNQAGDVLNTLKIIAPADHVVLAATSSLAKLLWLQGQPEFPAARYFLHQADWLGFLLHGQLGISDYHNALKLGYDPAREVYPDWFQHPVLAPLHPFLPKVVAPGTVIAPISSQAATRWQINPTCAICAGTTDSMGAFLASGATALGTAVTSLGSTLVLKLISPIPIQASAYGIYSHRCGDYWLVGGASNCGGAILKEFFTDQELESLSAAINPDIPSELDYYPLPQAGERFPIHDPDLQPRLDPKPEHPQEFLHGLLESLARIEAQGYRLLVSLGASPLKRVYTAGGGAKNGAWTKIRTRVLGVPVQASPQTEAAYGTALLALRGLAAYENLAQKLPASPLKVLGN